MDGRRDGRGFGSVSTAHVVDETSWPDNNVGQPPVNAVRLSDGRILAWAEYGNPGGVPVLLLADQAGSRLAPGWLLHDSALPSGIRLLAVDRPGTGLSDPVTGSDRNNLARDLSCLIVTLAVGRVAVVAIGAGATDGFVLAASYPAQVAGLSLISPRTERRAPQLRQRLRPPTLRRSPASLLQQLLVAAGERDLREETTWPRALHRLAPAAVATIDQRWRQSDFRAAIAADAAQTSSGRISGRVPPGSLPTADIVDVPVTVWRGAGERPDSFIKAVPSRPGWQVTTVPGPTASLGYWPEILRAAVRSWTETAGDGDGAEPGRDARTNDGNPFR